MNPAVIVVRPGELMLVEQQSTKAIRVAQFEFVVHLDGLERTDLHAYLAAHADRNVDVEHRRIKLRFANVIRLLVLALGYVDALGRTFLLANLAGDTPQARMRVTAVEHEERKIARRFLGGKTPFGILDRRQPFFVNIAADEVLRRFRQTFDDAFAEHEIRITEL